MFRWFIPIAPLALVVAVLAVPAQQPDGIDKQLAVLENVGREGKNNVEAGLAWNALVARGTPALIPILDAMLDDNLTSTNWLRPAFDTIAERTLDAGKTLPRADLEKFVIDTKKAGVARRLAYEWLVKIDKTAPERLLPNMLLDPNADLRRDAVELATKEADKLSGDKAKAAYRKVLKSACDQDQVDVLAKALDKLKDPVDLVKHYGFVTNWHLVAPFDHQKGVGWDKAYPPEKSVDRKATYDGKDGEKVKWVEHTTPDKLGMVNLKKALGPFKGAVAYAHAIVESPKKQAIEIRVGCINGLKVFLNGKPLFAREEYHHGMKLDQYAIRGTLEQGKNEILLKVCQNEQEEAWAQNWQYQLRLCDYVGSAIDFTQPEAAKKEEKK